MLKYDCFANLTAKYPSFFNFDLLLLFVTIIG